MYQLTPNDIFAEEVTSAYEPYDKEIEIKVLIDLPTQEIMCDKFKIKKQQEYDELYLLVTLDKKYKNITFLETEMKLNNGDIVTLPSSYSFQEKEHIRKIALQKMREEMFKNF